MGRSQFTFRHNLTANRSMQVTESFLRQKGLTEKYLKSGEKVWKDGTGILLAPGFLSMRYEDCKTTAFAWIQSGLGLTARSEQEIYGIAMMLPKRKMTKLLAQLEEVLSTASPE